ncbi:MAG: ABC transporter ATP-binding protein/permease [Candidatus Izemoplasma sp.]
MIKLNNLHKYFNKNSKNPIHVINDINLELPDKGLVVLLGPSGSGKTTLLNVLGGLDKVNSGTIMFDDLEINHYKAGVWDKIRNKHVGYIFQNYNLLTNLTVYDNISFTLNMIGVLDKDEIDKRIDYLLGHMGMENYRKRRASQLSGGQQQRVAIARALAKNPKVIIADEPTGNLDSKNTIDIMNIIKQISKEKLVVLVTHEQEIANFYADRIIELVDGVIVKDTNNTSNGDLELRHETDIYLKDLENFTEFKSDSLNIKGYTDETIEEEINVRLILKGKKLYLDIDANQIDKIEIIGKDSEVNIFDRHFEKVTHETIETSSFNYDDIVDESKTIDKHSVISFKETFKLAFNKIRETSRGGKLLYVAFAGAAVLIAIASGLLFSIYHIEDKEFVTADKDYVIIEYDGHTYDELIAYEANEYIDYISFSDRNIDIMVVLPMVYSYSHAPNVSSLSGRPEQHSELSESDMVYGELPTELNDIVIDITIIERSITLFGGSQFKSLGINQAIDFLDLEYYFYYLGVKHEVNIVGISDTGSPSYYISEEMLWNIKSDFGAYEIYADDITIVDGELPSTSSEFLVWNAILSGSYTSFSYKPGYNASGSFDYTSDVTASMMLMKTDDIKRYIFDRTFRYAGSKIYVNTNDVAKAIKYFDSIGVDAESLYETEYDDYFETIKTTSKGVIIFSLVILGASSLSYYFIIRSSLISRIYEISVYRALGVSKFDINKIFIAEIVLKTTVSSTVGFLATSFFLMRIQSMADEYYEFIYFSFGNIILGLGVIYAINIIAGLLPVTNLLRKTPAEILSKYDL